MPTAPLIIKDIIGEVVSAVDAKLFPTLNKHITYEAGRSIQILTELVKKDQSITLKGTKYPLFALFQPFTEINGKNGWYCDVTFPKIIIACLSNFTNTNDKRYTNSFEPILYPIYDAFLKQLPRHRNIVGADPGAIMHLHTDQPGPQPRSSGEIKAGFNDYVDAIEINNLQLTFKQIKSCSSN